MNGATRIKPVPLKMVWAVCLVPAVLCSGVHALWVEAHRERLPNPVAVHWSGSEADGFSSITGALFTQAGLVVGLAVFLALTTVVVMKPSMQRFVNQPTSGQSTDPLVMVSRLLPAMSVGLTFLITGLSVWSLYGQFGLADARTATMGLALPMGLLLGVPTGVFTHWLLVRSTKRSARPPQHEH